MKIFFKRLIIFLVAVFLIVWLISLAAPRQKNIVYGLTFSFPYANSLGLDWKQAYLTILDDLKPKNIRLSAYWDEVEKVQNEFDFTNDPQNQSELNFQVNEASKRGTKIVLALGRRLPRWPECHDPSWIGNLSQAELQNAQLSYMEAVVRQYQNNPNIIAWQVENEPFLGTFGICPKLDTNFLDTEIALVKKLDPARKIIITDSGELNFWFSASSRGDIFGTTLYRYVFSDRLKRYWTDPIPPIFYRFKAGLLELMHPGKQIAIIELEAEPWTTAGIPNTPIDQQFKTMSMSHFNTILGVAHDTGFSPQYLWGAEWWYWMKTKQNHPEFWDKAKQLMAE